MSEPQEKLFVENLINRPVEEEITQSYIDYAMSVIVSRALPDVRDGLKPVLRRIMFAMYDIWLTASAKHRKSATVVWEVLGKYHPHGDSSVYDAMVRLAQPFAMRYPMVDGQGNFWSVDGDPAAAMRYTEARLTKLAEEMLDEINQDTVDRRENYDQTRKEPITLPTKFPYTLCNGTMGIAVGMATNLPPHNLNEVIDACLLLIEQPEATLDQVMEIVKWPDFPTWGMIFDSTNIKEVYAKGRGSITMRWKHHLEISEKKEDVIIMDELPYQVNKANLVAKIGDLVNEKKLEGIYDITDESSKNLMRVSIHLKKWTNIDDILTRIYKYTDFQTNFSVNNVALIEEGRQPRHLNILELLTEFVVFRRIVVRRRSEFQLSKAKARLHILEGLQQAIDILDAVIETIKSSQTREEAKNNLMEKYGFSDEQAEYILMLRLQTLVGLEIQKILGEIGDKKELIAYLTWILEDQAKLDAVVIDEMIYMKDTYGDPRKTIVVNDPSIYDLNQHIKELKRMDELIQEPVITWIGWDYKIKVLYQTRILNVPQETFTLTKTHNQDKMIAITDTGELVIQRLKDLGRFTVQSEWLDVVHHFGLKSHLVFSETMGYDFDYLVMITNQNTLKKIDKKLLLSFKKFPTTVMWLAAKEKIIKVLPIKKNDQIWVITEQWRILIFDHKWLRPMGKTAAGVKAIALQDDDKVADIFCYANEPFIFIHDDQNGKMVSIEDLVEQKRGPMRRAQAWVICAEPKKSHPLRWAIAIIEGGVNLLMENGRIDLYDSNKMDLCMPEDNLTKITNGKIIKMRRPRGEKEEQKEKEEQQEADKKENGWDKANLFS